MLSGKRSREIAMLGLFAALLIGTLFNGAQAQTLWTTSKIQGRPEPPAPYRIISAFPKLRFQKPTSITDMPKEQRLLVTEIGGKVFTFPKSADVQSADLVVDLVSLLKEQDRKAGVSLWSATLHPDFDKNRQMFVCYRCPTGGEHNRVSRFQLSNDAPLRVVDEEKVVITYPAGPHSAGCVLFGKDGMLYISTGDGTGPNPPDGNTTGQDVSDLLGSILRIDVNVTAGNAPYRVPQDNPFVDFAGARPEIWAFGLRNPWKFGVDFQSGSLYVADNGWETWEMIHRVDRGTNAGWPVMEGRAVLRGDVKVGPTPIRPPVKDHSHVEANSVIGGPVYRGSKLPQLNGAFIYGDYITGTIWSLKPEADGSYSHATLVDTDLRIVGFAEGSRGELFVLDMDFTGQIYELAVSDEVDRSADFPRQLSQTGLFSALAKREPAAGVVPYDVVVRRWQDGAQATRWIGVVGQPIALATADKAAEYPAGTVLVKHLELPATTAQPAIPLETQVLHYEQGTWRPYSYLWDAEGKDATLVGSFGAERQLRLADGTQRTWRVNATNECKMCHNAESGYVIGFSPHQLDRQDQLSKLAAKQVITPTTPAQNMKLVDPHDASQPLEDRARSYLHGNCGMCHQPGGNAIVSFFLRRDMPFEQLNTNRGTRIGTFGMHNAKVIASGDPYRSILMYRMSTIGYGRMPYIGSYVADGRGIALVEAWLRSLASDVPDRSPPLIADSAEVKSLATLGDAKAAESAKQAAIQTLVATTEGSLALIAKMHAGNIAPTDMLAAARAGYQSSKSDLRGLFESFLPEGERRKRLGPNIQPETILKLTGDAARGKLIYFSDAGRCRACHDPNDAQKSLGPTMAEINKKYPTAAEMLQHVLQPSLKIEEKFAAYAVITTAGRVETGLLVEKNDQQVVLKTGQQQRLVIRQSEIDSLQRSSKSLMPEAILGDLTAQEAADLLTYVRELGR